MFVCILKNEMAMEKVSKALIVDIFRKGLLSLFWDLPQTGLAFSLRARASKVVRSHEMVQLLSRQQKARSFSTKVAHALIVNTDMSK